MTDNKQTVLTDDQNAIIAARFPDDPANACRAQSAIVEILSKLRGAGEPVAFDRGGLMDLIAEHLSGTYHCTRVWSAWGVGTMSQDDFEDVGESDTPGEIADAIIGRYAAPQASADPTRAMLDGKPLDGEFSKVLADNFDELCIRPAAEDSAKGEEPDIHEKLKDPNVVHVNMLRGTIAPITFDQLAHILGDEATAKWIADRQQHGGDVAAVLRQFLTGDGFIAECDIPHIVHALTATKGESNG